MKVSKNIKNSASVYGIPPKTCYTHCYELKEKFERNYSVLIPDGLDGQTAFVYARCNNQVDCYETNDILLNGGIIDTFKTIGFYNKIKAEKLKNNITIIKKNFYENKVDKKYDFVYCYRSLQLNKNKNIPMDKKIKKLMTAVKDGGYLYIFYYMAEDDNDYEKYPCNQFFRPYEIKKYFDPNVWNMEFCIESKTRLHNAHPYNNVKHTHLIGTMIARKKKRRNTRRI